MLKKPENAVIAAQNEAVEKCVIENYLKKISKGRAVEVVGGNIGATPGKREGCSENVERSKNYGGDAFQKLVGKHIGKTLDERF